MNDTEQQAIGHVGVLIKKTLKHAITSLISYPK